MAVWKKFEDIESWQKSRELSNEIYEIGKIYPMSKDYDLCKQMKRSSGSVMDNIAEGFERGGTKEFIYFLSISKGSSAEVRSQLYRCLDQSYIENDKFDELYSLSTDISKMITGLMAYLKNSKLKGSKFHEDAGEYQAP
jgi:four helix bundle protein